MGGLFFLGKDWVSFKMSLNNEIEIDPKYWKSFKKDSYRQDEENQGGPGKKRESSISRVHEHAWVYVGVCSENSSLVQKYWNWLSSYPMDYIFSKEVADSYTGKCSCQQKNGDAQTSLKSMKEPKE